MGIYFVMRVCVCVCVCVIYVFMFYHLYFPSHVHFSVHFLLQHTLLPWFYGPPFNQWQKQRTKSAATDSLCLHYYYYFMELLYYSVYLQYTGIL